MAKKTYRKAVMKNKKKEILTPIQAKRVAIAKDALNQIKLEKYKVLSGNGYVVNDKLDKEVIKLHESLVAEGKDVAKVELRTHLDKLLGKVKKCEVCAKGALFLSAIRKFNNFSLKDSVNFSFGTEFCEIDDAASDETRKIFGKANADLIERYFEKSDPYKDLKDKDGDHVGFKWSHGYEDDQERLIAILKNIIANKGTFAPKKLVWKSIEQMEASGW
jgi:hypothetical protein